MIKLIIAIILAATPMLVNAWPDALCMSECIKVDTYQSCQKRCENDNNRPNAQPPQYPNTYQAPQIPRVDYQCVYDCKERGYAAQLCQKQCSY